jgi:uncharacterized protein with FMN-binding domain
MRRITMWLLSTVAAVVLLFSYRTSLGSGTAAASGTAAQGQAPGIVSGGTSTSSGTNGGTGKSNTGTRTGGNTVVNGAVADTRWGPVQVQVTIASGKITDVAVLQQPSGNRHDDEINSYALPILHDEVLQAQSASINAVSGATVTSDGYVQSLQAALDAAKFGK